MRFKFLYLIIIVFIAGCSALILKPADFAWPVESVLKVDDNGNVQNERFSFSFNAKELFLDETGDSLGYKDKELRIIRSTKGYYFITGENFKDVYVFNANDGALQLKNKIEISDSAAMESPALNQRSPFIELIYGNKKINLTDEGIEEPK